MLKWEEEPGRGTSVGGKINCINRGLGHLVCYYCIDGVEHREAWRVLLQIHLSVGKGTSIGMGAVNTTR